MPEITPWVLCVTGAESTGKTTLARQLSDIFDVPLVPEMAREHLAGREHYGAEDVLAIAEAQLAAERQALTDASRFVVADTDLTVIRVWWEEKFGAMPPWLVQVLATRSPRRYLLPRPDLPWEFDPLRESPHDRPRLHQRYKELLAGDPFVFAEVSGSGPARLDCALKHVAPWLAD